MIQQSTEISKINHDKSHTSHKNNWQCMQVSLIVAEHKVFHIEQKKNCIKWKTTKICHKMILNYRIYLGFENFCSNQFWK